MESVLFIQIHADNQIASDNERDSRLEEQIRQRLARFEGRITDVEVHVSDVNGPARRQCRHARLDRGAGQRHPADRRDRRGQHVDRAVIGAAKKVVRALDHQLGKLNDHRR
jgi:hypothetical protein